MANLRDFKIYLSSSDVEEAWVRELYDQLQAKGLNVFWLEEDALPGSLWGEVGTFEISKSDAVIVCLSYGSVQSNRLYKEASFAAEYNRKIVPVFQKWGVREELPDDLAFLQNYHFYVLEEANSFRRLLNGLNRLAKEILTDEMPPGEPKSIMTLRQRRGSLIVKKLTLSNIRCLENLELDLETKTGPTSLIVILGDNAAGKTTLLRCLALGLCSESDASFLFKQVPGAFIREGAEEGIIRIELRDPEKEQDLSITTRITKSATDETIRKETTPDPFPWEDLFICAYGTNRSQQAKAGYDVYNLHEALRPLFDDTVTLKNPELVLLREEKQLRTQLEKRLLKILMLDEPEHRIDYRRTGAYLHGPWGDQPINTLSDGYRSTTQWVIDFLGWAIYAGRINGKGEAGGILIVDEIEQHLHPQWQRHIIQRLHQQLPTTQIFVSTHTPLIASGAVDVEGACLVRLKMHEDGAVEKVMIDPKSLANLRADQVLATEAFGLLTSRNPGSADDFDHYAELLGKERRSEAEEEKLKLLRSQLEESLALGETPLEREIGLAVDAVLKDRLAAVDPDQLDIEVKRQLRSIFRSGEES